MAIVDHEEEAAPEPPRRLADPGHGRQIDFGAPPGLQLKSEAVEVRGKLPRRHWPITFNEAIAAHVDEDLSETVAGHHHDMGRQGIEELVGEDHPAYGIW